ncbi:effector-associated constant component EACC1 [Streptomyces prasinopilosus]|uniref:Uncharacterized protein n=1 Tax=Streptomyces prasinopilosus TaxID=67344 RepID=A0A1G6S5N3_9ACTN|nr:hypothetical protein [Streptomyces prasinopilosus]SDD11991.1 hypothetical protein SAMN05216505_105178 [Streptomyces prasinopilosus]
MIPVVEIRHPQGARGLEGLRTYLVRDPRARRLGRVHWQTAEPKAGELGDGLDALGIVLTSLLTLPSFLETIVAWRKSRGQTAETVEIRLGDSSIHVRGTEDPAEIRRLAETLMAAYPEDGQGTSPGSAGSSP